MLIKKKRVFIEAHSKEFTFNGSRLKNAIAEKKKKNISNEHCLYDILFYYIIVSV